MSIVDVETLSGLLTRNDRLLGIDLGTKTIGLALSDVGRSLATPLRTIARTKFTQDATEIFDTVREFQVAGLVVGLPLNMDGTEGARVQSTRAFVRNLMNVENVAVAFWDERLSTAAVERQLIVQDVSRKKRAAVIDQMAAAYILQGVLDRIARTPFVQYP